MANKKEGMSVEDIIAACRKTDGKGGVESAPESAAPAEAKSAPPEESPPKQPPPTGRKPSEMSVAEIMAAARASGSAGGKPAKPAEPIEQATPAAGSPAKKPSEMSVAEIMAAVREGKAAGVKEEKKTAPNAEPKKPQAVAKADKPAAAKAQPAGPKDTASILAAARKSVKPGPMSKAQAAAKGKLEPAKPAGPELEVPPMPEKPLYARAAEPTAAGRETETRRSFFATMCASVGAAIAGSWWAVGASSLLVTHLLWLLGFARFMFPNILVEPPTRFKVGFPDDFAPGQVETKFKAQFGVWIVRYEYEGQPQIYALKSVCTHLGCTPNWLEGEQKFKCPCHGSGFYKDGINFEGPAPRPLERYAISLASDGQLEVDKSREFKEEMGQWKDSASYVKV